MTKEICKRFASCDGHAPGDGVNTTSSTLTYFEDKLQTMLRNNDWICETSPILEINDDEYTAMRPTHTNVSHTCMEHECNSAVATDQETEISTSNTKNQHDHISDNNCCWCNPPPLDNVFNIQIIIV